ncbi:MAG TPA: hypothetical protein VF266_18980 [Thermoanaerobaculia bacterium]
MLARALLLLIALPAFAATTYEIRKQTSVTDAFTVFADGGRIRVDQAVRDDDAILYTSLLWTGGPKAIALNARNATWYELSPQPLALKSHYLSPYGGEGTVKNLKWTMSETNGTYTARLTYEIIGRLHGERVKVHHGADYVIETTDQYPRALWLGRIFGDTKVPEVDAQLAAADPTITRFPTRMTLTATRRYEGGAAMTDVVTIETRDLRETKADASKFVRPAEYRQQEPQIAVPGVMSR